MRDPDLPEPPPVKHSLGAAKFEPVNAPPGGAGPPPVDVHEILRANLDREKSAGLHELQPLPPRRSRRRRDYWLLLISGNVLLGLVAFLAGPGSPVIFVSALAGMALGTAGLTWIMWCVMDDY